MPHEPAKAELLFLGGVPGSGAAAVARVLGAHSHYREVPGEARFHCEPGGLCDLVEGRMSVEGFAERLRGEWSRPPAGADAPGLPGLVGSEQRIAAALERLAASLGEDPLAACRNLFWDLLWPLAQEAGKPGLVERSSANLTRAAALRRIFPGARFVHVVRDGRAIAAVGGDGPIRGIGSWAQALRGVDVGVRGEEDGTSYTLGPDELHVLVACELFGQGGGSAYNDLLRFLAAADEPAVRAAVEAETASWPGLRDWEGRLPGWTRAVASWRYRWALSGLERQGVHCAPQLIDASRRFRGS